MRLLCVSNTEHNVMLLSVCLSVRLWHASIVGSAWHVRDLTPGCCVEGGINITIFDKCLAFLGNDTR